MLKTELRQLQKQFNAGWFDQSETPQPYGDSRGASLVSIKDDYMIVFWLGFSKMPNGLSLYENGLGGKMNERNHGPLWTKEELEIVYKNYSTKTFRQIHELLPHRSFSAVKNKVKKIKFRKD